MRTSALPFALLALCTFCNLALPLVGRCQNAVGSGWAVQHLVTIPWSNEGGVPYTQVPGANLGAVAFALTDSNRMALLCNSVSEIRVFANTDGVLLQKFPVVFAPRDFVFANGKYYVLADRSVTTYSSEGSAIDEISLPDDAQGATRVTVVDSGVHIWLPNGNTLTVYRDGNHVKEVRKGWLMPNGTLVFTAIVDGQAEVSWNRDAAHDRRRLSMAKKVAGVFPVGLIENRVVLDVQTFLSESPVSIERRFIALDMDSEASGLLPPALLAPDCYYVYSDRDVYQSGTGQVYHMVTTPSGAHVFRLTACEEGPCTDYPSELRGLHYHFNYHLIKVD